VLSILYAVLVLATLALFQAPDADVPVSSFAGRSSTTIAAVLAATAAITAAALAFNPDAFGFLAPVAGPIDAAGEAVVTYVLGPIFFVIALPFQGIAWLLSSLFDANPLDLEPPQQTAPPEENEQDDGEQPGWFRALMHAAIIGGGVLALAIVLLLTWFAFRRYARRSRDPRERRESLEAASTLGDDLGALFDALRGRLRRRPAEVHRIPVRRLYFDMIARAASAGVERAPATTPLQFAPDVDAHFRSEVPSAITDAFDESRYGEREIDEARVRELRERWEGR
jgi:hypothetical protein